MIMEKYIIAIIKEKLHKVVIIQHLLTHLIGGISGRLRAYGVISYCYNLGDIENKGTKAIGVGGIVGENCAYNGTTQVEERKSIISYCYNKANIVSVNERIGGIAGLNANYCEIKNCYVYSNSKIKYNTVEATNTIGDTKNNYLGKIIGWNNEKAIESDNGIIDNMPTVYKVVNGLKDGSSEIWSNSNVNAPKLKWEK